MEILIYYIENSERTYVTCHRATGTYENRRTGPHNILADYLTLHIPIRGG